MLRSSRWIVGLGAAVLVVSSLGFAPSAGADARTPVYVALGDSYTSGYGARPYLPDGGACGRSAQAYPNLVTTPALQGVQNYACAGATTADLDHHQPVDPNPAPQFDRLAANQTATTRVAYVSLTIGGNDAALLSCLNQKKCKPDLKTIKASLISHLEHLSSLAPGSKIMVMSYGGIEFASTPTSPCAFTNTRVFNKTVVKVDRTVKAAMKKAARSQTGGATFLLVDDPQVFHGHELCSASADQWVGSDIHPNAEGNARLAADVDHCFAVPVAPTTKITDCIPAHP